MKLNITAWQRLRDAARAPHEPENMRIIADVSWATLVVCAVAIAIVFVLYGISRFRLSSQVIGAASAPGAPMHAPLDRAKLEGIVEGFNARAEHYNQLEAESLVVPDPSQ